MFFENFIYHIMERPLHNVMVKKYRISEVKRRFAMDYRTVGVVVARFQTPELHEGHRYLLSTVAALHRDMLVVLGSPSYSCLAERNPMDFATRRIMVRLAYPGATIVELIDSPSDK